MKVLLSLTHPQVAANLYEFLSSTEHKGRFFLNRTIGTKLLFGTIDFHSRKKILWK